jgi:hypothetical protein
LTRGVHWLDWEAGGCLHGRFAELAITTRAYGPTMGSTAVASTMSLSSRLCCRWQHRVGSVLVSDDDVEDGRDDYDVGDRDEGSDQR